MGICNINAGPLRKLSKLKQRPPAVTRLSTNETIDDPHLYDILFTDDFDDVQTVEPTIIFCEPSSDSSLSSMASAVPVQNIAHVSSLIKTQNQKQMVTCD